MVMVGGVEVCQHMVMVGGVEVCQHMVMVGGVEVCQHIVIVGGVEQWIQLLLFLLLNRMFLNEGSILHIAIPLPLCLHPQEARLSQQQPGTRPEFLRMTM